MKIYAYQNNKGEIKQAEIEVEKKTVLVPKNDTYFPVIGDKEIYEDNIGVLMDYFYGPTVVFDEPNLEKAIHMFHESAQKRMEESQKLYDEAKKELDKLERGDWKNVY